MDEVSSYGSAELLDDGSIEIEFASPMATRRPNRLLKKSAALGRNREPDGTTEFGTEFKLRRK